MVGIEANTMHDIEANTMHDIDLHLIVERVKSARSAFKSCVGGHSLCRTFKYFCPLAVCTSPRMTSPTDVHIQLALPSSSREVVVIIQVYTVQVRGCP